MKIKNLIFTALILAVATSIGFAQSKTTETTPDAVVKNLYAAQKDDSTNPFIQTKNRALVDKYFAKELGNTIWKTAARDNGWNFDPLTYGQDSDITNFVIGRADENNTVKVKFKNFGKDEEITFSLVRENPASKSWKIESIGYSDAEDLGSLLESSMMSQAEVKAAEKLNKLDGDYMVGNVRCSITQTKNTYWARVQCDDQENFQIIDTETLTFGTFNPNEKGRRGKFVSPKYGVITKFVDASGKETKVTRVK